MKESIPAANIHYRPPAIALSDSWYNILWREKATCGDDEWAAQLNKLIGSAPVSWGLSLQDRPPAAEVEHAIKQAVTLFEPATRNTWADPLARLAHQQQTPDPIERHIADLGHPGWASRFVARHALVAWGGEAVPRLRDISTKRGAELQTVAQWLLASIEHDTSARLSAKSKWLLCLRCLVYCGPHWDERSGHMPYVHYGCRTCGQSRDFLQWAGHIVTVLDKTMTAPIIEEQKTLRGNWFQHRNLFDCNWVEILQANDEDVERFAVQIGNDTDSRRQGRYHQMRCFIGQGYTPSKNTRRILERTFGRLEPAPEQAGL